MGFSKQNVKLADVGVMEDDTDLHWACFDGDEELVAAFLDEGADINCCSAVDGGTPLMRAAEGGHLGCTFMCVQAGAFVNTEDRTGRTALHFAWSAQSGRSQEEKVDLEDFLIQAGARGCRTGCRPPTPTARYAISVNENVESVSNREMRRDRAPECSFCTASRAGG